MRPEEIFKKIQTIIEDNFHAIISDVNTDIGFFINKDDYSELSTLELRLEEEFKINEIDLLEVQTIKEIINLIQKI